MMDEYRRGWAHRYLREAKAELQAAQKIPYMAPSLMMEAIRKARNAIYYSLGEPAFIEVLVRDEIAKSKPSNDIILRFLIEMEKTVQQIGELEEINGDAMMKQADTMVQVASEFVETLTDENVDN
jgi:hypothetical protein